MKLFLCVKQLLPGSICIDSTMETNSVPTVQIALHTQSQIKKKNEHQTFYNNWPLFYNIGAGIA
jgi:hypothetical protein